jgi:hypothetical protein
MGGRYRVLLTLSAIRAALSYIPSSKPHYCGDDLSSSRRIPPLLPQERSVVDSLEQVQVVMRHGARVPVASPAGNCWVGYNISWAHCKVEESISPVLADSPPSQWQFRKVYDGSETVLGGDCELGQLTHGGFKQAEYIGKLLREAYIGHDHDEKLSLLRSADWSQQNPSRIYFRSDDEGRKHACRR